MANKDNKPIVMEMSNFVATMVANNSQIERTGIPMTDEEFTGMYNTLPNTVRIEIDQDVFEKNSTAKIQQASSKSVSTILGGAQKPRTSRSRRGADSENYDEVSVLLELNTPGKVRAFRKSNMFNCEGRAVTEEEFIVPEGKHKQNPVYLTILEHEGVYGTYAETRKMTLPGVPFAKTAKPKTHKKRYSADQEGDRAVSLETVVPIECCGLFQPSKATVSTFIGRRSSHQMDNFLEFMAETNQSDRATTLLYLAGLFDVITDEQVATVQEVLSSGTVPQDKKEVYRQTLEALINDLRDTSTPIQLELNYDGTLNMSKAIYELMQSNRSLKELYDTAMEGLKSDKYLSLLLEDASDKALASIISSYIPMALPEIIDMGPEDNLELIFNLMQLAGGHISNGQVTLTVKECDVVSFGN